MTNQVKYKIKELRKKHGDTLKDLAKKIHYDYSNLSKIERGLYDPSLSLLEKIANAYNVNITYFLNEHTYTPEKISFIENLDLSCKEFSKKYHLLLDGKKLSEIEMEFVIEIIRNLRKVINKQNNQN